MLGDRLCVLEGYTPTGRDEGHVNILEAAATVLEQAYRIFLPTEGDLLPRATPEANSSNRSILRERSLRTRRNSRPDGSTDTDYSYIHWLKFGLSQ